MSHIHDDDQDNQYQGEEGEQSEETQNGHSTASDLPDDDETYASPEQYEKDKGNLVDFLQFPREKRKITDFLEKTYKSYENETVARLINRVNHEHTSELQGATPYHKPGHIGPLMFEYLNMIGVEAAFVSGLQHTKSSMTKSVQQRVDEINTLLRGVGGFNRQIKASFSRSATVYLEQEDPRNKHRQRVIFTVNLGDYELRYPLDESANDKMLDDGRSLRRMVWDEAVNTLAEIVSNTGMKPKYVKNDKNSCVFTMRQYLLSESDNTPDEFFTFDLRHVNAERKERMTEEYVSAVEHYESEIAACKRELTKWWVGAGKKAALKEKIRVLNSDRDFYVGTHADPREMDCGLVFSISVSTLKDYGVTKDKMQVIMTKYILALSSIAVDKSLDQQVNTVYQRKQNKPKDFQNLNVGGPAEKDHAAREAQSAGKKVVIMKDDLVRKKAAGGGFKV